MNKSVNLNRDLAMLDAMLTNLAMPVTLTRDPDTKHFLSEQLPGLALIGNPSGYLLVLNGRGIHPFKTLPNDDAFTVEELFATLSSPHTECNLAMITRRTRNTIGCATQEDKTHDDCRLNLFDPFAAVPYDAVETLYNRVNRPETVATMTMMYNAYVNTVDDANLTPTPTIAFICTDMPTKYHRIRIAPAGDVLRLTMMVTNDPYANALAFFEALYYTKCFHAGELDYDGLDVVYKGETVLFDTLNTDDVLQPWQEDGELFAVDTYGLIYES